MDIASLSMALSQNKVMSDVGVALLGKSLDMSDDISSNISDMISNVPAPSISPDGVGANIDITI
ncbi:MAG: YjfB family protein [Lachnotalea sp.]